MTKHVFITTGLAAVMALGACTDPAHLQGTSGVDPYARTKGGAAIGGVVGGIAGALTGDTVEERRRGAIIGAVVGAGAGAAIGNHLDKQAADLRADLNNSQIAITNTGERLIVTMPQGILFATDSTSVRSDLRRDLGALAGNLMAYPNSTVQVVGHTDNVGDAAYNQDLSRRRAQSVSQVLFDSGVSPARVSSIGRGEDAPVATNLTPEGRAQNRRVEIVIIPNS